MTTPDDKPERARQQMSVSFGLLIATKPESFDLPAAAATGRFNPTELTARYIDRIASDIYKAVCTSSDKETDLGKRTNGVVDEVSKLIVLGGAAGAGAGGAAAAVKAGLAALVLIVLLKAAGETLCDATPETWKQKLTNPGLLYERKPLAASANNLPTVVGKPIISIPTFIAIAIFLYLLLFYR